MSASPSDRIHSQVRRTTAEALERCALAVGRLDGTAAVAPEGFTRLLELRCAVVPFDGGPDGMIAILRADREGESELVAFDEALRQPNADDDRGTGGAAGADDVAAGLLAALVGARERMRDGDGARDASLAFTRALWRDGVLGGPWLSLPYSDATAPDPYGDADAWLALTCGAIAREATAARDGLTRSRERVAGDEAKIRQIGRAAYSAIDLFHLLTSRLIVSIGEAAIALGQTVPTAGAAMERLERLGVAREVTGRAKGRRFAYRALVNGMAP